MATTPKSSMDKIREQAKAAQQKKTIYEKLSFGREPAAGDFYVRFEMSGFEEAINPNPLPGRSPEFFTTIVKLVRPSPEQEIGTYSIAGSAGSGLGDEILKLWAANGENLLGVYAKIVVYNYDHKKLKKRVRGYRVEQIQEAELPPLTQ